MDIALYGWLIPSRLLISFNVGTPLSKLGPLQFAVGWRGIAKSWTTFLKFAALEKGCGVVSVESRFCFHGLNLFEARLCSIREKRSTRNLFSRYCRKRHACFHGKFLTFLFLFFLAGHGSETPIVRVGTIKNAMITQWFRYLYLSSISPSIDP